MSQPPLIVIFGAAVRPGGQASEALLRRIAYGYAASRAHPDAPILCSGGVCRPGPSEASIMAEALLARGVAAERLILDEASLSTLHNVAAAVRQARSGGHADVVLCSDGYHLPRIRIMLAVLGVAARAGPVPADVAPAPLRHRLGMILREALAIPHNLAVLLARGRRLTS